MITLAEVKQFLEDMELVKVTDFAKTLKPRHKNGKKRK